MGHLYHSCVSSPEGRPHLPTTQGTTEQPARLLVGGLVLNHRRPGVVGSVGGYFTAMGQNLPMNTTI
jgi:hypothetical protein